MGWSSVLTSQSTAVEKIDALVWLQLNVLDRYLDEFKVQLAWLRQSPPRRRSSAFSFQAFSARAMRSLVTEGVKAGTLRRLNAPGEARARLHHRALVDDRGRRTRRGQGRRTRARSRHDRAWRREPLAAAPVEHCNRLAHPTGTSAAMKFGGAQSSKSS